VKTENMIGGELEAVVARKRKTSKKKINMHLGRLRDVLHWLLLECLLWLLLRILCWTLLLLSTWRRRKNVLLLLVDFFQSKQKRVNPSPKRLMLEMIATYLRRS